MKNIITKLVDEIDKAKDKPRLMSIIDEIGPITERSDDIDVVDALLFNYCY